MKIIVLAGGADQIALIKELKIRGHEVILLDYLKNPPAKKFADKHFSVSTLDIDGVREIAIKEKVNLITTACTDQALLTAAKVSEELSLSCYLSYKTALSVTNKSYMKQIFIENDIPTSKYFIFDIEDLSKLSNVTFPVVVKPVDCNSSKGVKKANNRLELTTYINEAIQLSRLRQAIVEEFQEGEELSVDLYVENSLAKLLCITSSKKIKNSKAFTIKESCYPAVSSELEPIILLLAQKIVDGFHLNDTPMLLQIIINERNECSVLEFSARMGGGSKYQLIKELSGIDIMSVYVDRILGNIPKIFPIKRVKFARMQYVYCNPGVIKQFKGFKELKKSGIIQDFFLYKTIGMEIDKCETSSDRAAGFLVISDDYDSLISKLELANKTICILDKKDCNIIKMSY